jgi:hypothetical protein
MKGLMTTSDHNDGGRLPAKCPNCHPLFRLRQRRLGGGQATCLACGGVYYLDEADAMIAERERAGDDD